MLDASTRQTDPVTLSLLRASASAKLTPQQRARTRRQVRRGRPADDGPSARYAVAFAAERMSVQSARSAGISALTMLGVGLVFVILGAASLGDYGDDRSASIAFITSGVAFTGVAVAMARARRNLERTAAVNAAAVAGEPEPELPTELPRQETATRWLWLWRVLCLGMVVFLVRSSVRDGGWGATAIDGVLMAAVLLLGALSTRRTRRARVLAVEAARAEREYRDTWGDDA